MLELEKVEEEVVVESTTPPNEEEEKTGENAENTGENQAEATEEKVPEKVPEKVTKSKFNDHLNDITMSVSTNYTLNTPLLLATHHGHLSILWLLLAAHYSPDDRDKSGNSALHLAAASGDEKIVKILLQDGANENLKNIYKNTPKSMASNKLVRDLLNAAENDLTRLSLTRKEREKMHHDNINLVSYIYFLIIFNSFVLFLF